VDKRAADVPKKFRAGTTGEAKRRLTNSSKKKKGEGEEGKGKTRIGRAQSGRPKENRDGRQIMALGNEQIGPKAQKRVFGERNDDGRGAHQWGEKGDKKASETTRKPLPCTTGPKEAMKVVLT